MDFPYSTLWYRSKAGTENKVKYYWGLVGRLFIFIQSNSSEENVGAVILNKQTVYTYL